MSLPLRLLIVDDNPDDRFAYRRMLGMAADQRYEIIEADSAEAALKILAEQHVQFVLLDLHLPDTQGLDLLQSIRAAHAQLPVVMLTGLDDVNTSVAALQGGADDYQVKGRLSGDSLLRAVRGAIDRRTLETQLAAERARLELFHRLIEQSADMLFVIAMPERRLIEINPATADQLGFNAAELLSAGFELDRIFPLFDDSWAALGASSPRRYECYGVNASGVQVPIEVSASRVSMGGREFYIGVARDISDRRQRDAELQRLVLLDALTGVNNRRAFDERFEQEFLRAARGHGSLGLLMIDVDHFKLYNDTYGHQAGDKCLRQVAQALAATLKRPSDFLARYGGEEFCVLLPDADLESTLVVAELLLNRVRELALAHAGSLTKPIVTISIGAAVARPPVRGQMDNFLALADQRLYKAKQSGRNRAVGLD